MKVSIEISARHIHLEQSDCLNLFGTTDLHKRNNLSEKGEFACNEEVEIVGPKNRFTKVRVLGPLRKKTQLEISRTDAYYLGVDAPLSLSGSGEGGNVKIVGPGGSIIKPVAMVAKRHFHVNPALATKLKLKDNDRVAIKILGERAAVLENIIVRISDNFVNNIHLDTDEGNACGISGKANGELITKI